MAEKISHQPPILASHCTGGVYELWQTQRIKSKFWGKSIEYIPHGTIHLRFNDNGDKFTWTKVSTSVRNILSGNKWLEVYGETIIKNERTNETCTITFRNNSFFSSSGQNEVTALIKRAADSSKEPQPYAMLKGSWHENLFRELGKDKWEIIWKVNPYPHNFKNMYCFTKFAIELNEICPPSLIEYLPSTDTRLRPDQRLYENGKVWEAETEKLRLEAKQRENRKKLEETNTPYKPLWFTSETISSSKEDDVAWIFNGQYWKCRESKNYPKTLELW